MTPDDKLTVPLPVAVPDAERATVPLPGPADTTVPLHPKPDTIGRFVVRGFLGSGAFGDVYQAFDPQLDREVALKVAKPGSLNTPERLARFLREAKAAANLRHPNIVPLFETGTDGDRRFIASAFINGRTLEAVVQAANETGQPLALPMVAEVGRKLADALAYAHSQGVVHRDVKPANVLVDAAGEPHLLDFGLAARVEEGAERLTQDGQGLGTPAYMAPEQAEGNGDTASDQYSLGCTVYELATGRTPFAGGPPQQVFLHRTEPVPSPRSVRKDIPKDLDTLILKCLEKEPARRYASCADLADDLRRFASGEPVKVRRAGPVERLTRWAKRNKRLAGMGLLLVLTMALGTGVSLGFGLYANEKAGEALTQKKTAEEKTDEVKQEKKNVEVAVEREKGEKEKAQRALAKALLGPFQRDRSSLNEFEESTLWELTAYRNGPITQLVLEEATASPLATKQLVAHAEHIFHAALGLNQRREKVDELISTRLRDPALSTADKLDLAMAVAYAEQFGENANDIADILSDGLRNYQLREYPDPRPICIALVAAAERLPVCRKVEICERAADELLAKLTVTTGGYGQGWIGLAVVRLAATLPAEAAERVGGQMTEVLVQSMGKIVTSYEQDFIGQALMELVIALAPESEVGWRSTAAASIATAMARSPELTHTWKLAGYLVAMVERIPADRAAELLAAALAQARDAEVLGRLAIGLATVLARLPPEKAGKLSERAADSLAAALRKTKRWFDRKALAEGLASLSWYLSQERCKLLLEEAAELSATAVVKEAGALDKAAAAHALVVLAEKLSPALASEVCGRTADTLIAAMTKTTTDDVSSRVLVTELVGLTEYLTAERRSELGVRMADHLALGLEKSRDQNKYSWVMGLAVVVEILPAAKAEEVCGKAVAHLVGRVKSSKSSSERLFIGLSLAALSDRVSGAAAWPVAEILMHAMTTASSSTNNLPPLVRGLTAVTSGRHSVRRPRPHIATPVAALAGGVIFHPDTLSKPRPLAPQQLVELLKHPFCVKEARRAVLDALEFTYDRKFADLWEFVAFAEKEHPELDLLTAPKRPEKVVAPPKADGKPK